MTNLFDTPEQREAFPTGEPTNISRRRFLLASAGTAAGALVLGFGIPVGKARAQGTAAAPKPGTRVPAYLEIRPDSTIRLQSPFMEGGQGVITALAQIVGEELDADPASFVVEHAPPGADYKILPNQMRFTGGSMSIRMSYPTMRHLGASARRMLLQAASSELRVPVDALTTEPGKVVHVASGRSLSYGQLASRAMDMPVPDPSTVKLKDPGQFRWIGKSVQRLDVRDKSTGKAIYAIDCRVDGMLHAAVQHAPRLGLTVRAIRNEDQVRTMKGVHSVHRLPGAVAVVAERWWNAKRAAEALQVDWQEPGPDSAVRYMPADFSTAAFAQRLANEKGAGDNAEVAGNAADAFAGAKKVVSATYHSQYLNHAQLEPPSALARFNADGTVEVWTPNQAPELYQADIAKRTGLAPEKIIIHSPLLGGFFGRHFPYGPALVHPQAIQLAKEVGRPVKVIWSREQEFLRDALRPMAAVRFRAALDDKGMPTAIEAVTVTEGPTESLANKRGEKVDDSAVEGLVGKHYAIANRRIARLYVKTPVVLGYWRSVGSSMNDFFYESFVDELADEAGHDPYELRMRLLQGNARLTTLLRAVGDLSGGWKRGPFTAADGTRRARGVAMARAFGTETAVVAEVSVEQGQVKVHDIWEAIDPGSIVNPAIIEAQVNGAVALGLSEVLLEEAVYEKGMPVARNYDMYPILPPARMARVHVRIIESGAEMGGIGEPPLPAVPPAVANAVARLTGQRVRSMPLSRYTFNS
ncbi:xanthine dehydrogenase family protein molybdopterin-binding subunit [Paraburkholderia terricola]|uniref:Isoquinoline 1-oxidoreductase, beta subunit n=1 Tax=Paraburkholderia terricola TaxID=169427 RepID=A0A1M6T4H2_9BURK|nr:MULTISPECIES: xanthine dehydrogenase family protein molybdopterin-binding subunit [Paraburkholderia]SDO70180.1 isoquinoline 1-oxidoreductase, beta subunit [Paraburkholderia sediminicola]SHK51810.1 isoquinoline 1-oxidoreductase, beta subunit [Paraburkholderia terricola]